MKEDKPGWQKAKPVDRVYLKYDPKNNLPTHEAIIPNQIQKEVKAFTRAVCVTNEANQNLNPSQKELLRWHFRLGHIRFQHVQWLIRTGRLKLQGNSKQWKNVKGPNVLPVSLERVIVDSIKPGWQKAEPVERVYVKYDPKNNLPTHEATFPNQR